MSFFGGLDRTVTITPRVVADERDDRGNEVVVDGEPFEVKASRELVKAEESHDQRDEQTRTYRYLLAPRDPVTGETITITGYDRLTDGDETFRIIGTPEYPRRRNRARVHHVELIAERTGPVAPGVIP